MNRTMLYKTISLVLVLIVLSFGNQLGRQSTSGTMEGAGNQGVVRAQSGGSVYLPLVLRQEREGAVRTINAPFFNPTVKTYETAIAWFGRVSPSENYGELRVGYTPQELFVRLSSFDRVIWYHNDSGAQVRQTLTEWDGMTLYLNLRGGDPRQPLSGSYKFVMQWNEGQPNHKIIYRGTGTAWQELPDSTWSNVPTVFGWDGNAPNNDSNEDYGWVIDLHMPFSLVGLQGQPANGTTWEMAVDMYDRDSLAGPPNPVKTWPSAGEAGRLVFGIPSFSAPSASSQQTVMLRNGTNGVVVKDAMVGGSSICSEGIDRWNGFGNANWYGKVFFNISNEDMLVHLPCYSKELLTFPLDQIPAGKVIVSAKLVINMFGNADPTKAYPSYIQVLRLREDWDPRTVTWNTTPLAVENYAGITITPITDPNFIGWRPHTFDVSRAVSQAYAERSPARLALYSSDWPQHSGKYFYNSIMEAVDARPRLEITYGNP